VGVGHVDKEEADPFKVTGAACGGEVFPVQLCRKNIQPFNGLYKFKSRFYSVFSVVRAEKSNNPNPESDKIKVDVYPPRIKGDTII
jgi:hypothetical protein